MSISEKLTSHRGKRNKEQNKTLAREIADNDLTGSVAELVELLDHKDNAVQSDAIELLYETGYLKPELIKPHIEKFTELLAGRNNRLVWGAMIALSSIAGTAPKEIFGKLEKIKPAIDRGSVITKDAGVLLLAHCAAVEDQKEKVLPLLLNELSICPPKQLPQYLEKSLIAVDGRNKEKFTGLINRRIGEINKESRVKRIEKVLKEINKLQN